MSWPNKTTNDVYYKRQLTCITFNIHVLSTKDSYFYYYDQTIAKKEADDVASMLYDFMMNRLPEEVRGLEIVTLALGRTKITILTNFRFCYWLVHSKLRFNSIKMIFPIRGHSYM